MNKGIGKIVVAVMFIVSLLLWLIALYLFIQE
jgi:hypothetical protein